MDARARSPTSHRVVIPAAATNSASLPPMSNSAPNSTMNDSGIMPRSSAVDDRFATAEMRIAERIRTETSRIRSGKGQPASPGRVTAQPRTETKTTTRQCWRMPIQQFSVKRRTEGSTKHFQQ